MDWEPIGLLVVQAICQEKLKKFWIITKYTYYDYHNYLFDVPRFQSCLAVLYKLRVVFEPLSKQRLNSQRRNNDVTITAHRPQENISYISPYTYTAFTYYYEPHNE